MSILANQKKEVVIDGVRFTIKKLSVEKQSTIAQLWSANKHIESTIALLQNCLVAWDAKEDDGTPIPLNEDSLRNMAVDVANKVSEEIMSFNGLNKEQAKN